jgi:hypothetical protein
LDDIDRENNSFCSKYIYPAILNNIFEENEEEIKMAVLGIIKLSRPALKTHPSIHSIHSECSFPGVKWLGGVADY